MAHRPRSQRASGRLVLAPGSAQIAPIMAAAPHDSTELAPTAGGEGARRNRAARLRLRRRRDHARAARARRPPGGLASLRRQLGRSPSRYLHGRWRPLSSTGATRSIKRRRSGAISRRPHGAALPEPRLQPAERRRRTLVRAGDGSRRRSEHADHPGILPRHVRAARPRHMRPGISRRTSSASRPGPARPASRRPRGCIADGVELRARAADPPAQHRARHDRDSRARPHVARQLYPDRSARRRDRQRRASLSRRHRRRAGRPRRSGVSATCWSSPSARRERSDPTALCGTPPTWRVPKEVQSAR